MNCKFRKVTCFTDRVYGIRYCLTELSHPVNRLGADYKILFSVCHCSGSKITEEELEGKVYTKKCMCVMFIFVRGEGRVRDVRVGERGCFSQVHSVCDFE